MKMKNLYLLSALLGPSLLLGQSVSASEYDKTVVTVTGSSLAQKAPDAVKMTLHIQHKSTSVAQAKQQADKQTEALSKALLALGVKADFLNNAELRIQPSYDNQPEKNNPQEYNVSREVSFTLQNLNNYSAVLEKAAEVGVTQLTNTEFLVSDAKALYQQALEQAFFEAKEKAELLAKANKMTLGQALRIDERGYAAPVRLRSAKMQADSAAVSFGQTDVTAEVSVVFEMHK